MITPITIGLTKGAPSCSLKYLNRHTSLIGTKTLESGENIIRRIGNKSSKKDGADNASNLVAYICPSERGEQDYASLLNFVKRGMLFPTSCFATAILDH